MADTRLRGLPKIHEKRKKTSRTKSASTDVSRSQKSTCRRSTFSAKPAESFGSSEVQSEPSVSSYGSRQSLQDESSESTISEPSSIDLKRERLKKGKFGPYFQNYFPGVSRKKPEVVRDISDDEDYDTDLEEDLGQQLLSKENVIFSEDNGLFFDYKRLCRKLKVVPNNFFMRHAMDDQFTMKHRYPGYSDVRALMHDIQIKDTISSLNLEDNGIGPGEMLHLGQMLLQGSSIQELKLTDNKVGAFGARLLKTVLLYNRHLVKVDIAGNKIGEKGAKCFAEMLERNVYLKELNLAHNSIAEQGALYLGHAIGANYTLDILDISWNNITPKGAALFARGLKVNINLKILKAAMNGFHVHGTEALAEALKTNKTLECLDISANRIPLDGAVVVARALTHNKGLKALKIGFNPLTVEGAKAIIDAVSGKHVTSIKEIDFEGIVLTVDFGVAATKVIDNFNIDVIYVVQPSRRSKTLSHLDKVVRFLSEIGVLVQNLFGDVKETNVILSSTDIIHRLKKNIKDVSEEKIACLHVILSENGNKRFLLQDLLQAAQKRKSEKERLAMMPLMTYSPRPAKNLQFGRSLWWSQAESAWGNRLIGTDMKVPSLLST